MESGYWPLYRFDPRRAAAGASPLAIDSLPPKFDVSKLMSVEGRFQITARQDADRYQALAGRLQEHISGRYLRLQQVSNAGTFT